MPPRAPSIPSLPTPSAAAGTASLRLLCYGADAVQRLQVAPLLPWAELTWAPEPAAFSPGLREADLAIVFATRLEREAPELLANAARSLAPLPIVLLLRAHPHNLGDARTLPVDELLSWDDCPTRLPSTVARLASRLPRRRLAATFRSNPQVPAAIRKALARACASERPPRTVKELAAETGRHRSTLWSQWTGVRQRTSSPLRLQDLIDWILLLCVLEKRHNGQKWLSATLELGIDERTLRRLSNRLTGRSPSQLTDLPPSQVWRFCAEAVALTRVETNATFCPQPRHNALAPGRQKP